MKEELTRVEFTKEMKKDYTCLLYTSSIIHAFSSFFNTYVIIFYFFSSVLPELFACYAEYAFPIPPLQAEQPTAPR